MLKFGRISDRQTNGTVRVKFAEDNFVSSWISVIYPQSKSNKEIWPLDINTYVACLMDSGCENGVCIGACYTDADQTSSGTSLDMWTKEFSDGSKISYNTTSNLLKFANPNGVIQFNGGDLNGMVKIASMVQAYNTNLSALKTAISASFALADTQLIALNQAGGIKTAFDTAAANVNAWVQSNLEDTKVTH